MIGIIDSELLSVQWWIMKISSRFESFFLCSVVIYLHKCFCFLLFCLNSLYWSPFIVILHSQDFFPYMNRLGSYFFNVTDHIKWGKLYTHTNVYIHIHTYIYLCKYINILPTTSFLRNSRNNNDINLHNYFPFLVGGSLCR